MENEGNPVAKWNKEGFVEYTCALCGGWEALGEVYQAFLPFIDHLIQDLCFLELPELSRPFPMNDETWYRHPATSEVIQGLPPYRPNSPDWQRFRSHGEKLVAPAKMFLPDVADWIVKSLDSSEELRSITQSDLIAVERLTKIVENLESEFREQREYLLGHKEKMEETATDVKWPKRSGTQAEFVGMCMAGARWNLAPLGCRELIRKMKINPRGPSLRKLGIQRERYWWEPVNNDDTENPS